MSYSGAGNKILRLILAIHGNCAVGGTSSIPHHGLFVILWRLNNFGTDAQKANINFHFSLCITTRYIQS